MRISVFYAICHRKKIFPPVFNFYTSPHFFQKAFAWSGRPCNFLSMPDTIVYNSQTNEMRVIKLKRAEKRVLTENA